MGFIRQRNTKNGAIRFQTEIRLKGHKTLTATFDRKTDDKRWIQKVESEIRYGRHQLYSEGKRHTLKEAIERYFKEQHVSVVKRGHLLCWQKELGHLYLQDVRPSVIVEKKQKLLCEPTGKGIIRSKSTCNRYLATLSHLISVHALSQECPRKIINWNCGYAVCYINRSLLDQSCLKSF